MKLIDLLVKELPKRGGWPEGAESVVQDEDDTEFYFFTGGPVKNSGRSWWFSGDDSREDNSHWIFFKGKNDIADDCNSSIVTRSQYEAALAKNDGWIEWGGGECPVNSSVMVDATLRDGHVALNCRAYSLDWKHHTPHGDGAIISYRLHEPGHNSRANDDRLEQDLNECIGQGVQWQWDGVPPVGCSCEMQNSKGEWIPVDIIAKKDGFTFGWSYDCRIVLFGDKDDEFRPLRTEAENARDEAIKEMILYTSLDADSAKDCNHIANIYDAIAAGKIPGVKLEVK